MILWQLYRMLRLPKITWEKEIGSVFPRVLFVIIPRLEIICSFSCGVAKIMWGISGSCRQATVPKTFSKACHSFILFLHEDKKMYTLICAIVCRSPLKVMRWIILRRLDLQCVLSSNIGSSLRRKWCCKDEEWRSEGDQQSSATDKFFTSYYNSNCKSNPDGRRTLVSTFFYSSLHMFCSDFDSWNFGL
jgi:hypothetical protein